MVTRLTISSQLRPLDGWSDTGVALSRPAAGQVRRLLAHPPVECLVPAEDLGHRGNGVLCGLRDVLDVVVDVAEDLRQPGIDLRHLGDQLAAEGTAAILGVRRPVRRADSRRRLAPDLRLQPPDGRADLLYLGPVEPHRAWVLGGLRSHYLLPSSMSAAGQPTTGPGC